MAAQGSDGLVADGKEQLSDTTEPEETSASVDNEEVVGSVEGGDGESSESNIELEDVPLEDSEKEASASDKDEKDQAVDTTNQEELSVRSTMTGVEAFAKELTSLVNHGDIANLIELQVDIHKGLTESKDSLVTFNQYSAAVYKKQSIEFENNTKMLKEMKRDLDYIFRKIRYCTSEFFCCVPKLQN
eukprot:TRINITY_DN11615_c0_g1_i1.p1 TRINITY_DN11615_c0_g1~~TRINITY_DN11615_c0_g1_i1.p1  ORF type:complete len:187 (-),score=44.51 TRINITY_DN11615_c0_g1_i1:181-741(-)